MVGASAPWVPGRLLSKWLTTGLTRRGTITTNARYHQHLHIRQSIPPRREAPHLSDARAKPPNPSDPKCAYTCGSHLGGPRLTPMADYPHIVRYREELEGLISFGGSTNEQSTRLAFANCLNAYCRDHKEKLMLVPELSTTAGIRPDGTVKDTLRLARGYWEAKDAADNLDDEIQNKLDRGYPRDNIIFEDTQTAVLYQNGDVAMRVDMRRPGELHRLIRTFLDYELPEIEKFHEALDQFKTDLPDVLSNLRQTIEQAEADSSDYQNAAAEFLALCHESIGPDVSEADVREMLLQHILTKDIFLRVFAEEQFHRENDIAQQLDRLEQSFFTGDLRRESISRLLTYYGAIGRAADDIADYAEKQQFLKNIYEDFYKAYNPAAADRLGVVYTPNEVVDFMIRGADYLLRKHFGRGLADRNVQILDPATGTGTFVTNLIKFLPDDRLEHKYLKEIHANEVAILPYYIANLNIEYSYKERTGHYLGFPNLCFVDTLDNMDWEGQGATSGRVTRQSAFNLGSLSAKNWERVQSQNDKPISVIIGNPPYNANQQNENDNNKNREYPEIDRRIKDSYVKESTAQKTKQYDMYKRFIRWASDRLTDDGIIAFVSNRSYLDARQDDGFRKVAVNEFSDIYVLDLGSDVRRNPKIAGTTHNVFGIQTGVAIGFFVREKSKLGTCDIHYDFRHDHELAFNKLSFLRHAELNDIGLQAIVPDDKYNWLDQTDNDFESLIPVANKQTKLAKSANGEQAIFGLYSLGLASNRDEWVWDFSRTALSDKMLTFAETYQEEMKRFSIENPDPDGIGDWVNRSIKWTTELERHLVKGHPLTFGPRHIESALFRPFVPKYCYYAPIVIHRRYQMPRLFQDGRPDENKVICFSGTGSSKPFQVLVTDKIYSLDLLEKTQCLPLYRYTEDGERISNITEWGLGQFREHYGDDGITAEEIFAYTYAALHDQVYRESYAVDLRREFPRLPFHADFRELARMGQDLLDLHIGFESVEPWSLMRTDAQWPTKGKPGARLSAGKEHGVIVLDETTRLTGIPDVAWSYRLGRRSAIEWVLDQYKERKPKDPTIAERFNTYRFADHKERVIDLLCRVTTVSVRTMEVVDEIAAQTSLK